MLLVHRSLGWSFLPSHELLIVFFCLVKAAWRNPYRVANHTTMCKYHTHSFPSERVTLPQHSGVSETERKKERKRGKRQRLSAACHGMSLTPCKMQEQDKRTNSLCLNQVFPFYFTSLFRPQQSRCKFCIRITNYIVCFSFLDLWSPAVRLGVKNTPDFDIVLL